MLQFFLRNKWWGCSTVASSLLLSACNFNLANSPFDGIPSFNNSNNINQLQVIALESSDKGFAREMMSFLGRNKVQVLTKNSTPNELLSVINQTSYEQYLAYLANSRGYTSWWEWQNAQAQRVVVTPIPQVTTEGSEATKISSAYSSVALALEQLPAGVARFDFAKFWMGYPNSKLRQQVLQAWNPEQDPQGFTTLFRGEYVTMSWLASSELRKFLQEGIFGAQADVLSQEQWLALQAAVPNQQLLEFTPAIEGCRKDLSFTCVARYVPTLRVTNITTQTKALSVFPNNGVVAQEAFIVALSSELSIPGAGVIQLNDTSQNDYVSNQYTPLASINRNSLLLTTAYKDLSRKIATKVVFVYNNQKIGNRQQWQQFK